MILKTLDTLGPQHGYGIARRIEQMSGDTIQLNHGTVYPALVRLEQQGCIKAKWGTSDNNRRAKYYRLTRAGRQQLGAETASWNRLAQAMARSLATTPQEI